MTSIRDTLGYGFPSGCAPSSAHALDVVRCTHRSSQVTSSVLQASLLREHRTAEPGGFLEPQFPTSHAVSTA